MNYLIGLGSNWQAEEQIKKMLLALEKLDGQFWASRVEKTSGYEEENSHPCYFNVVVVLQTSHPPDYIRRWCKQQEKFLGRGKLNSPALCEADIDCLLGWKEGAFPDTTTVSEPYYQLLTEEAIRKWRAGCPSVQHLLSEA